MARKIIVFTIQLIQCFICFGLLPFLGLWFHCVNVFYLMFFVFVCRHHYAMRCYFEKSSNEIFYSWKVSRNPRISSCNWLKKHMYIQHELAQISSHTLRSDAFIALSLSTTLLFRRPICVLLKVSKSQKQIMKSWMLPKNNWNAPIHFIFWKNLRHNNLLLRFTAL